MEAFDCQLVLDWLSKYRLRLFVIIAVFAHELLGFQIKDTSC